MNLTKLEKFETVTNKMNKITKELSKNIELSDDMLTTTEDLMEYLPADLTEGELILSGPTQPDEQSKVLAPANEIAANVVNVQAMTDDFAYMRALLRDTTQNSKRVLESITEELMMSDGENRADLIVAFSELNKVQIDSMRLFVQSYKEVSAILVNLAKVNSANTPHTVHTTNVLNIEDKTAISSADIINRLRGDHED